MKSLLAALRRSALRVAAQRTAPRLDRSPLRYSAPRIATQRNATPRETRHEGQMYPLQKTVRRHARRDEFVLRFV